MAETPVPVPSPEEPGASVPLDVRVGRDAEVRELAAAWGEARAGRGRAVLLTGESGMGKTQLLGELAARARHEGAAVLEATCPVDELAPPLWPWMEICADARGLRRRSAGNGRPELELLDAATPPAVSPLATTAGSDRFVVYDGFVELLRELAAERPVMIVLDDFQWADSASFEMLRHLAPRLRSLPILLLCAGRSGSADTEITRTLADYGPACLHVHLEGLDRDDLTRLVARLTGRRPPLDHFVGRIRDHTGGNPFFVREVLRLVVGEGLLDEVTTGDRALPAPATVQAVLLRRVGGLSRACRDTLEALAVAGSSADLDLLAAIVQRPRHAVVEALDEAAAARLVVPGARSCCFAHDLVRSAVYDSLEPHARRARHLGVATVLEQRGAGTSPGAAAALAHHWVGALPDGDPGRAAHHAGRAAAHAGALFAHTEAAAHYRYALAALDLLPGAPAADRLPFQIALGDALQRAGRAAEAEDAYDLALDLARVAGDASSLARAALGRAGPMEVGHSQPTARAVLEEALEALGDESGALPSMIRSRLGVALLFTEDAARRQPLIEEALSMARADGDVDALAAALYARHVVMWAPDNAPARVAVAEELRSLGDLPGRRELGMWGRHRLVRDFVELGELARADHEIAGEEQLAAELHQPLWHWLVLVHRGMRKMMQGHFGAAEELVTEAVNVGRPVVGDLATLCYGSLGLRIRLWQGRLDEVVPALRSGVDSHPQLPSIRCSLALVLAEAGDLEEAAAQLDQVVAGGLTRLAVHNTVVTAWADLASVTARLGNREHAEALHDLLAPLRGRFVVGPFAEICLGAVDRYLAILETTTGRGDDARASFEAALELNRRAGARPTLAQTRVEYGTWLGDSDPVRARELLAEAYSACADLGMHAWAERARAGLAALSSTGPPASANRFVLEDRVWRVAYDGREVLLPDSKGMRDLAQLVARPGQEVHVLELSAATEGHVPGARPLPTEDLHAPGPADEVLDARARAAYRERIAELEAELAEAEHLGDSERAAHARAEQDTLVDALAAALGLGGRSRRHRDDAERARQAVAARIRYALDRLADAHPALAHHLRCSVRTGRFCSYAPEGPVRWQC